MTLPLSIIMPVWNGEKYLKEAIESILGQTFVDFEFLIIDDGSTDATESIVKSYPDSRIRFITQMHSGIVVALNRGLEEAQYDWIARMDSDDYSFPDRLEKQVNAINRAPSAVLCHTGVVLDNPHGDDRFGGKARQPRSRSFMALKLCYVCPIFHSTVVFNKGAAKTAGGYLASERHAEDYALWGRLLAYGRFLYLTERLVRYRVHPGSVSASNVAVQEALHNKIAVRHCHEFLGLGNKDADRAHSILRNSRSECDLRSWIWLLLICVFDLKWKSFETYVWLTLQTVKVTIGDLVPRRTPNR